MNRKLRRLRREIERRGGIVHIEETLDEQVAERFLREILECPDCMAAARKQRGPLGSDSATKREH